MKEICRYKGGLGEVVWLWHPESGAHTIEIEYKGLYRKCDTTYDIFEAFHVFWHICLQSSVRRRWQVRNNKSIKPRVRSQ